MSELKTYHIPIVWESYSRFTVQATNLQEAVELALKEFLSIPDDYYLDDSVSIDEVIMEELGETFDLDKALDNIS